MSKPKSKDARKIVLNVTEDKMRKHETNPSRDIYIASNIFKPSIIPVSSHKDKRMSIARNKKVAYRLHCEVNELKVNYAEDANSLFRGECAINPPTLELRASSIKVGTDCSGIEAPIIPLNNMGIQINHVFCSDADEQVIETIKANHNPKQIYSDVHDRDLAQVPEVDVYVAGFPCQPFSTMGRRAGMNDQQGTVFFSILDYIAQKLPKVVILESVKALVTLENGKILNNIMRLLRAIKFRDSY